MKVLKGSLVLCALLNVDSASALVHRQTHQVQNRGIFSKMIEMEESKDVEKKEKEEALARKKKQLDEAEKEHERLVQEEEAEEAEKERLAEEKAQKEEEEQKK